MQREARVFAVYYTKALPSEEIIDRYVRYFTLYPVNISSQDEKILAATVSHPWLLGFLDAGLALLRPHAELRRRLYVMFALLESDPSYTNLFLSQQRHLLYSLRIGFTAITAGFKALAGILIIKVVIR